MPESKHVVEEAAVEKNLLLIRISRIVDGLVKEDETFRNMDRTRMMERLSILMENPPPDLTSISDDELTHRIRKVMLTEMMSGMLNDLSSAQMESFDEAVKRRRFFG